MPSPWPWEHPSPVALADRHTPRPVVTGTVAAHTIAYGGLFLAFHTSSPAGPLASAAVLGATTPPVGPVIRSTLARVVDRDQLPATYALDSAINETTFILGPVLVAVSMTAVSAATVVVIAGSSFWRPLCCSWSSDR